MCVEALVSSKAKNETTTLSIQCAVRYFDTETFDLRDYNINIGFENVKQSN